MTSFLTRSVAALALAAALSPVPAFAHLAGGQDIVSGDYLLDFGHDPENPEAGRATILSFTMREAATQNPVLPESVSVRVTKDGAVTFAGTLSPIYGAASVTTVFPEAGDYDIAARFDLGDKEIEGAFTMEVEPSQDAPEAVPVASSRETPTPRDATTAVLVVVVAMVAFVTGMSMVAKKK